MPAASPPTVIGSDLQPEQQEPGRRARQDGVRHGIAGQAHAPQHQEDADRARAGRKHQRPGERALHESEFDERRDEQIIHGLACSARQLPAARRGAAWSHGHGRAHGRHAASWP